MKKTVRSWWVAACLGLAGVLAVAGAARAASAEDELRQFVDGVHSIEGRFVQTQSDEHGELLSSGAGTLAISRPGRFRWDYEQPYPQLMVCDGLRVWAYDPDLAQVTVRPAAQALTGTPAELLARKIDLQARFRIEDRGVEDGLRHVHLEPRQPQGDFASIDLWLKAGVPQRLRFADPLGGRTEVELRGLKVNAPVSDDLFRFTPPKGVEVVEAGAAQ